MGFLGKKHGKCDDLAKSKVSWMLDYLSEQDAEEPFQAAIMVYLDKEGVAHYEAAGQGISQKWQAMGLLERAKGLIENSNT